MPVSRKNPRVFFTRVGVLKLLFLFSFVGIIFKLFVIQIVEHDKYKVMASEQHWIVQEILPKRGDILSRDGFVLAGVKMDYILFAEPQKILQKNSVAKALSETLSDFKAENGDEEQDYYKYYLDKITELLNSDLYWVIVEKGIDSNQKAVLEKEGIEGIGFEEQPVRYYPENTLGAHILGFVASNESGDKQGYFGIEGKLNGDLKGRAGRIVQEKDAKGAPILIGGFEKVSSANGRDVILTINRSVQYLVEKKLKEGVEKYKANSGSVIVMDPMTSEVIAMANYPTYSPGDFDYVQEGDEGEVKRVERRNLSISETYEPGSVLKPLTVASALDLGKITLYSTYDDSGPVQYSDYVIDNWDGKHYGILNIIQLLQKSNNIGAAWVGHQVGSKKLSEYLIKFGLGTKTGIDLEGEDTGIIRDYKTWTDIDLATISFGQGISATPLQVLNSFNVFANGGELYQPKIVHEIIDNGKRIEIPPRELGRVISAKTAESMMGALVEAVSGGESSYFNIKNYKIAGKTGTAQIPLEGKYDPNKTNATFLGIMAASKKFSMIVKLNEPTTSIYAAETAVPLWMEIANELIKYYGLPPDIF